MQGYIRLYRKIRDNPIFNDMQLFRLWMICLTEATHKERNQIVGRQTVQLKPGQFVTGRFDLQGMYNRGLNDDQQKSPKTVWRWLELLEKGEYLTIKPTNKYSVVSILNWHKYQFEDQQNDQQVTNKRPTNDQQVTTNNNDLNVLNELPKTSSSGSRMLGNNPFSLYEKQGFGKMDETSATFVGEAIDIYGEDWTRRAMVESVKQGKKVWSYVEGILKRWKSTGHDQPWTLENDNQKQQQNRGYGYKQTSPKMDVVKDTGPKREITPEERERMLARAKKLKEESGGDNGQGRIA